MRAIPGMRYTSVYRNYRYVNMYYKTRYLVYLSMVFTVCYTQPKHVLH